MDNKSWKDTLFTYIWIFNVGRGLSIFIRTGLNQGFIYDFGASDDFSPTDFMEKHFIPNLKKYNGHAIAQTIISHPHLDHISEIEKLLDDKLPFQAYLHTCPHDKENPSIVNEKINWDRITNPEGSEDKINIYRKIYKNRNLPLQTIGYDLPYSIPNLEYGLYYIRPPVVDELFLNDNQKYSNGISIVLFLRHGFHTLLIPGDMPPEAMEYLLEEKLGCEKRYTIFDIKERELHPKWHKETSDQPSLQSCLKKYGVSVLIAPHHGLESGYSEKLYSSMKEGKPSLVVISEKRHLSTTDGQVDGRYQSQNGSCGLTVNIEGVFEKRYSISTRNEHHILVVFPGTSGNPRIYAERDPEKLLGKT